MTPGPSVYMGGLVTCIAPVQPTPGSNFAALRINLTLYVNGLHYSSASKSCGLASFCEHGEWPPIGGPGMYQTLAHGTYDFWDPVAGSGWTIIAASLSVPAFYV